MTSGTRVLRPYYRSYELPWSPDRERDTGFRKLWVGLLLACLALGFLIWLVQLPERPAYVQADVPERFARLVIERELPPPPPPPPPPEVDSPQVTPREAPPQPQQPRQRAARAGLLAFQDELADIRQQLEQTREQLAPITDTTTAVDGPVRSERSLITSRVGASSGGIGSSGQSRGFGSGAGSLGDHSTARVVAPAGGGPGAAGAAQRGQAGDQAARSREEIELVFDRNKGAIYALYSRALREQPDLQGKLVLEFTIAPSGEVTMCRVVSSELGDPELERRIVARVRMFRFEAKDVAPVTTTKPIDFFPA